MILLIRLVVGENLSNCKWKRFLFWGFEFFFHIISEIINFSVRCFKFFEENYYFSFIKKQSSNVSPRIC